MKVLIEVLEGGKQPVIENGVYKCFAAEDGEILPQKGGLISLGIRIGIPNTHFINVFNSKWRSLGGVGDSDYRGTMYVIAYNSTQEVLKYKRGEQIGCFSLIKIRTPPLELIKS